MQNDKKYLLRCAESAAKFINEKGSGGFISLVIDMLNVSIDKFQEENRRKLHFCEIIYKIKNSRIDKFLGGGKNLADTFKMFVEDFLMIRKEKEGYVIINREFGELTVDELNYVLGWTRRLIEKETETKEDIRNVKQKGKTNNIAPRKQFNEKRYGENDKIHKNNRYQESELFNDAMASQLKNFLEKTKE